MPSQPFKVNHTGELGCREVLLLYWSLPARGVQLCHLHETRWLKAFLPSRLFVFYILDLKKNQRQFRGSDACS